MNSNFPRLAGCWYQPTGSKSAFSTAAGTSVQNQIVEQAKKKSRTRKEQIVFSSWQSQNYIYDQNNLSGSVNLNQSVNCISCIVSNPPPLIKRTVVLVFFIIYPGWNFLLWPSNQPERRWPAVHRMISNHDFSCIL